MKWLPFELSPQEKQAMKELGKDPKFKAFQKEIIIYLVLLGIALVFFWKHPNILMLFIVVMSWLIASRYSQTLKGSPVTSNLGEKLEKEIKRQQELTQKIALPILFGMVAVFILVMAGLIIYVLYLK